MHGDDLLQFSNTFVNYCGNILHTISDEDESNSSIGLSQLSLLLMDFYSSRGFSGCVDTKCL